MEIIKKVSVFLAVPLVVVVYLYQKTLSLDHGPLKFLHPYGYCKFYPTCSEYAKQVLVKDGVLGLSKIFKRVISCTPASLGGVDLPPHQE
jgi:putative membrane protein insertion efficiency factor